ncbi:hypothetical protein SAMN02745166_02819 [Prosthecobacter debontii]|uniref:Uncharacterized protein n=1 Tax=Prosthecobacter debontii TaxID=48467 RepID=A0A1T4YAA5_9BACT|nr:hypothetical protein SAMN02745166_02819 [Prosthecobacter debontii]
MRGRQETRDGNHEGAAPGLANSSPAIQINAPTIRTEIARIKITTFRKSLKDIFIKYERLPEGTTSLFRYLSQTPHLWI